MTERKIPVRATPLTPEWVIQGLRVELPANSRQGRPRTRTGMLTGLLDRSYPRPRVEVMVEGTSTNRPETWAMADVLLLPRRRQLVAMGGGYEPPRGYPLNCSEPGGPGGP